MKISELFIENFRGIRSLDVRELGQLVVLVGVNGSGKSSVFDAIRFVKSCYGSYVSAQEELVQLFSESQLRAGQGLLERFGRDKNAPFELRVRLEISDAERDYLKNNAVRILRQVVGARTIQQAPHPLAQAAMIANRLRNAEVIDREVNASVATFAEALDAPIVGKVRVTADNMEMDTNLVFSAISLMYEPAHLGVFDFHGPDRTFQREPDAEDAAAEAKLQRRRQHALYNHSAKYANLRAELAASFTRELLLRAGSEQALSGGRTARVFEQLFATFLPDKQFLGPRVSPEGLLRFPVSSDGLEYDINDLSSGEREIVLGYVRLIESSPTDSVLIIDEPELHLHPRICRALPAFYERALMRDGHNQLLVATHSDAFVRGASALPDCTIIAAQPPTNSQSQISVVRQDSSLESALSSLIGVDYRPSTTVVFLEGGDEDDDKTGFDKELILRLFPEARVEFTFVSVGNRSRVEKTLRDLRETASAAGLSAIRLRGIVDRDHGEQLFGEAGLASWDVFHIENYLLEPVFVYRAFRRLSAQENPFESETAVDEALKSIAKELLPSLVCELLENHANRVLLNSIPLRVDRSASDAGAALRSAVEAAARRVARAGNEALNLASLQEGARTLESELSGSLSDGTWRARFRGRDILRTLAARYEKTIKYEKLRNLIIAEMVDAEYQPAGMGRVLRLLRYREAQGAQR